MWVCWQFSIWCFVDSAERALTKDYILHIDYESGLVKV